jgi:type II secretion system protein I
LSCAQTRETTDAGFTLVEVLVAFAVLALALAGLYASLGGSARTLGDIELRDRAAAAMQSHLDTLVTGPHPSGGSQGRYSNGIVWRAQVLPLGRRGTDGGVSTEPARVMLTTFDGQGRVLLTLETIALIQKGP